MNRLTGLNSMPRSVRNGRSGWHQCQIVSRAGKGNIVLAYVSDPNRAKALDLREVGVVRHNATLQAEGRGGNQQGAEEGY